ncbi:MAG: thioredoxin domain-containing protein [Solirubrobacterales bacterium]|nr:thioredoxin domain-containing protein [Solirubrobacterales bacterium]
MASRTKQKEEARARRLEQERARAEQTRRNRRLRMVGGVVLGAVIVVAIAIAVSSGGSSGGGSGLQTGTKSSQTVTQVNSLLSGIPQSGATLGNPNAKVTVDYYGDLECPICRDFTLNGGWPQLVANEVRQGKVKVVYRAFQTATPSPQTFQTQQIAALAAGKQDKFWNFMELFYHEQGTEDTSYVTESYLTSLAQQAGVNLSTWNTDRKDPALLAQVESDGQSGNSIGVQGTPTLVFFGPKGSTSPSAGVPSYSDLQSAISKVS